MNELETVKAVDSFPALDAVLHSWDSLAGWIKDQTPELAKAQMAYYRGSLAIGAAILKFSESADVKAELEAANKGRPGAKWEPYNFVARKLSEKYGKTVPSAKHLGRCARAAEVAIANGQMNSSLRELLGWKTIDVNPAVMLPEIDPESLRPETSEPKSEPAQTSSASAADQPLSHEAFANRFVCIFEMLAQKSKELAARKPSGDIKLTPRQRAAILRHMKEMNRYLLYVNMALGERQN